MAIAQPASSDALDSPSHSTLHKIIAADLSAAVKSLIVDAGGNVGIGTETFGTSAAKVLALKNGTPPSSSPADEVQLYAEDALLYGADKCSGGTASSGSTNGNLPSWAFADDASSSFWMSSSTGGIDYLEYDFGSGVSWAINKVRILPRTDGLTYAPKTFTIKGSNNDSTWTTLATVTGQTGWSIGVWREFTFTNSTAYRYIKIDVTAVDGGGYNSIAEVEMVIGTNSSELKVRDEAGNITTLSPHNFALINPSHPLAWAFHSKNAHGEINVDMFRVIREVEKITGKKFIHIGRK